MPFFPRARFVCSRRGVGKSRLAASAATCRQRSTTSNLARRVTPDEGVKAYSAYSASMNWRFGLREVFSTLPLKAKLPLVKLGGGNIAIHRIVNNRICTLLSRICFQRICNEEGICFQLCIVLWIYFRLFTVSQCFHCGGCPPHCIACAAHDGSFRWGLLHSGNIRTTGRSSPKCELLQLLLVIYL